MSVTNELDRRRPRIETHPDRQTSGRAAAHGALGVQDEIEQRLLQLAAVGDDRRKAWLELRHELDAAQPELVGAQRQHALHELGEVLRRARRGLPPGEREQVADDARGALRLLGDATKIEADFLGRTRRVIPTAARSRGAAQIR